MKGSSGPMRVAIGGMYPELEGQIRGGVEAVVFSLVQELQQREGLEIHVVSVRRTNGPDETRLAGKATIHLLAKGNKLPFSMRVARADARRVLAKLGEIKPDLVHAHGIDAPAVAAVRGGYPTLLCVHGILHRDILVNMKGLWDRYRLFQANRLERFCLQRITHLAAISPYVCDAYRSSLNPGVKVALIENPVMDPYFDVPPLEPTKVVLFAGLIVPRKGVHFLMDAFARVAERHPDARLRLAGGTVKGNAYLESIKQQADRLRILDKIDFLGHLNEPQMLEEYARCHVLCLPSQQETTPVVIQQAMAAGRPVVSTRIAGIPGQVEEGRTGFLTQVGDIEATAQSLCRILDDAALAREMGIAAKQTAEERFRLSVIGDKTLDLYREILNRGPST